MAEWLRLRHQAKETAVIKITAPDNQIDIRVPVKSYLVS